MASKGAVDDPLRGGGTFNDQDMEDLTAHLANLPTGRGSHDGLDLGDNTELLQGNMDRFRALAGDDNNDDLFTSFGGLGLGLGAGGPGASSIITTTNYPTYGELAAAKPPSYEDSIMYEQAPLGMHAGPLGGGGGDDDAGSSAAMRDDPLMGGGGRTAAAAAPPGPSSSSPPLSAGPGSDRRVVNGAGAHGRSPANQQPGGPLGGASPGPGGAGSEAEGSGSGRRAGAGCPAAAALDSLVLPGSGDFRDDDLQALSLRPSTTPGGRGSPATPGPGRGYSGSHLAISVSDPVKREQGGLFGIKGGYVTYLVRGKYPPAAGSRQARPETTVRRRFREFVALAELLKEKYRGFFVPPRPEKNAMEGQRMTDGFVEERRLALERYLNKLARHPVISASEELRLFLDVDGELADSAAWLSLRPLSLGGSVLDGTARFSKQILGLDRGVTDPVQAAQPTKKATDFMRAIKETARSMHVPTSALPADELALQRAREELDGLQGGLTAASRAAEKLVARLDRWSVVNGELGMALFQLRKAEQADGVALAQHTGTLKQSGTSVMHNTERLGTALVRSSRIGRKVTGRCAIELGCLHEYLGLMPAALKGLRARDKALLTSDTLQADLEGRRRAIQDLEAAGAKVLGGDAAKAKKVADLNGDVAVLEQSIVAARAQYDKIKGINQQEMSRLHSELRGDMLSMLHHYAAVMSACSQRNLEIWLQAAGELQATPEQLQAAKASLTGPMSQQHLQHLQLQPEQLQPAAPSQLASYPMDVHSVRRNEGFGQPAAEAPFSSPMRGQDMRQDSREEAQAQGSSGAEASGARGTYPL